MRSFKIRIRSSKAIGWPRPSIVMGPKSLKSDFLILGVYHEPGISVKPWFLARVREKRRIARVTRARSERYRSACATPIAWNSGSSRAGVYPHSKTPRIRPVRFCAQKAPRLPGCAAGGAGGGATRRGHGHRPRVGRGWNALATRVLTRPPGVCFNGGLSGAATRQNNQPAATQEKHHEQETRTRT